MPPPYAKFALPAVLVLGLLALAVAMLVQGTAPATSGTGVQPVREATGKMPVPPGQAPSLAWPVGMVIVVGVALAACWYLYSELQRLRQKGNAERQERAALRHGLDGAQAQNAQLHAELEQRMEQIRSLESRLRAPRAAPPSTQQTTRLAPRPHRAGGTGSQPVMEATGRMPVPPSDRPDIETLRAQLEAEKAQRAADSARHDQAAREMAATNAGFLQKWRDSERARLEEHETLRRQHEDALAGLREEVRREEQELEARFAPRILELEGECEKLRKSLGRQQAKGWPPAFQTAELEELRRTIAQELEAEPPPAAAVALFGMVHQLCATADTERGRDAAFEMSRAFYLWCHEAGHVNRAWDEQLASWLTELLKMSRVRVLAVKPGEPVSARLHSPEGSGPQVKRPLSFLVLREDGTPYKRALVAT